jgi:DNA-binding NarL/FixJ family response regulator
MQRQMIGAKFALRTTSLRKLKPMQPYSVLKMDPNPAFLRFVVHYIEERHSETAHVVGAVFRASDALMLAGAAAPQVAIVGLSGPIDTALGLIADLRRVLPEMAVVAMSQLGSAGYAQAALEAGADCFVDKDSLLAELGPAIRRAVDARRHW